MDDAPGLQQLWVPPSSWARVRSGLISVNIGLIHCERALQAGTASHSADQARDDRVRSGVLELPGYRIRNRYGVLGFCAVSGARDAGKKQQGEERDGDGDDRAGAVAARLPGSRARSKLSQFLVSNHAMFAALSRRLTATWCGSNLPRNDHPGGDDRPGPGQGFVQHRHRLVDVRPGEPALRRGIGPGSTFSLDGDEHRERRKLLAPPFHGKRMQGYEHIIEKR